MIEELELPSSLGLSGTLRGLARVNILCGPNGSGKSRVLRALDESLCPPLLKTEAPHRDPATGLHRLPGLIDPDGRPYGIVVWCGADIDPTARALSGEPSDLALDLLLLPRVSDGTIERQNFETVQQDGRVWRGGVEAIPVRKHGDVPIGDDFQFPSGALATSKLFEMHDRLLTSGRMYDHNHPYYVLAEEPESNLHPRSQMDVLRQLVGEVPPGATRNNTGFFITTHSPFVVRAASEMPDAKVYFLDDGRLLDGCEGGFTGPAALLAYNKLLGVGVGLELIDLCFLEASLKEFIEVLAERQGAKLSYVLMSVGGGDSDSVAITSTMTNLADGLVRVGKLTGAGHSSRPASMLFVADGKLDTGVRKRMASTHIECVELRESSLEDLYPRTLIDDWSYETFGVRLEGKVNSFIGKLVHEHLNDGLLADLAAKSGKAVPEPHQRKGFLKRLLAAYVGERITDAELEPFRELLAKLFRS
jgi:hypothetical protein